MQNLAHRKMTYVIEALVTDGEYLWLQRCRDAIEAQAAAIYSRCSSEERDVLMEYWGLSQEIMLRAVEIACFMGSSDDPFGISGWEMPFKEGEI